MKKYFLFLLFLFFFIFLVLGAQPQLGIYRFTSDYDDEPTGFNIPSGTLVELKYSPSSYRLVLELNISDSIYFSDNLPIKYLGTFIIGESGKDNGSQRDEYYREWDNYENESPLTPTSRDIDYIFQILQQKEFLDDAKLKDIFKSYQGDN